MKHKREKTMSSHPLKPKLQITKEIGFSVLDQQTSRLKTQHFLYFHIQKRPFSTKLGLSNWTKSNSWDLGKSKEKTPQKSCTLTEEISIGYPLVYLIQCENLTQCYIVKKPALGRIQELQMMLLKKEEMPRLQCPVNILNRESSLFQ